MKKVIAIVVLGLLLYTNAFALVCHPSYKFHPPEIPDPDELLGKFPIMKPYKPPCIWNSTPCTELEYETYRASVNTYNMMLNQFGVYYDQYFKDLKIYLEEVNNFVKCDIEYVNEQIQYKKNSPF